MSQAQISQTKIESALRLLCCEYNTTPRKFMTESDIVIQAHKLLQDVVIKNKPKHAIHSELRPYKFDKKQGIKDNHWRCLDQINHAAKCDLAIVLSNETFWKKTKDKITCLQSKNPNKKKLRYWRFLIYPVEAFQAAFEFKMRVQGNLTNIREDIDKLVQIKKGEPDCLTYMIVLDKVASPISMNTIREYSRKKGIPLFTHLDESC